jgi:phosphatidylethanolamine/phosphatidyl-N-methylethanolamine N-methyltransferase
MSNEAALFLRQFLSNPRDISSVVPSSRWLARGMAEGLGPNTGRVVEFGPGTGRITHAILEAGVAPADLTLFEMNGEFVRHLQDRFRGVTIHHGPAQEAPNLLPPGVAHVISGLPLLSFPGPLRQDILRTAFSILAPGGSFVQFTYADRPALDEAELRRLGLRSELGRKIWANIPPARIYRLYQA